MRLRYPTYSVAVHVPIGAYIEPMVEQARDALKEQAWWWTAGSLQSDHAGGTEVLTFYHSDDTLSILPLVHAILATGEPSVLVDEGPPNDDKNIFYMEGDDLA